MIETKKIPRIELPECISNFPFDVIKIIGSESVDFLQRITTNELANFTSGEIRKTLLVTDKGRIFDTVWVIHNGDYLLLTCSKGMASDIIVWLNKYIIMEEIVLTDVSSEYSIDLHFKSAVRNFQTDFFGFPVFFGLRQTSDRNSFNVDSFEAWRIENGIPAAKKELVQDFNPLELNLWDWISFTKGCYIGQEVIARLDTYNKIQRTLCRISSTAPIAEQDILFGETDEAIGKITSVAAYEGYFIGLAVLKVKFATESLHLRTKTTNTDVLIEKVFRKGGYGRN